MIDHDVHSVAFSRRALILGLLAALCLPLLFLPVQAAPSPAPSTPSHESGAVGGEAAIRILTGNGQFGSINQTLGDPVAIAVQDSRGGPIAGLELGFMVLEGRSSVLEEEVRTDALGRATFNWRLGGKEGGQRLLVRALGTAIEPITLEATATPPFWFLWLSLGLLGGLGIFLYGMEFMGDGLQRWAGEKMRAILAALTRNRVIGLLVGLFVTAVIQSSSATTVMLVGFTNAGLMSLAQAIGVILGADIGTTITAQVVAFKLTDYALGCIGIGFLIYLFAGKNRNLKYGGQVLLGFGFIFFGLKIMSDVILPLKDYPPFVNMLRQTENPFVGLLASTVFTSIIQSSSATTSLIVVMSSQGLFDLRAAIPLIFGANIGTCVTAALAAIGTTREAKRVAIAHYSFKIAGVLIFWFLMDPLAGVVEWISIASGGATSETVREAQFLPRQVANAHTVFNVAMALLFLPWTGLFERAIYKILPEVAGPSVDFHPRYLDQSLLSTPEVALVAVEKEVIRMGEVTQAMTGHVLDAFRSRDLDAVQSVIAEDDKIDTLDVAIRKYLTELAAARMTTPQSERNVVLFNITNELEHIGDVISKEIMPLVHRLIDENLLFSEDGWLELRDYHDSVFRVLSDAVKAIETRDMQLARELTNRKPVLVRREKELRRAHLARLHSQIQASVATSEIHLELMAGYSRILSYATNIAYAVLGEV